MGYLQHLTNFIPLNVQQTKPFNEPILEMRFWIKVIQHSTEKHTVDFSEQKSFIFSRSFQHQQQQFPGSDTQMYIIFPQLMKYLEFSRFLKIMVNNTRKCFSDLLQIFEGGQGQEVWLVHKLKQKILMNRQRTAQSPNTRSPNRQLDESSVSTNRGPLNRESVRARMMINQSHYNAMNQGAQIRKQIATGRASAKGEKPNEFNAKKYVTKDLKEQDIIDIKQVFDYYDSESAGILSPNDLEQLLTSCGYHPTKETLYEIFSELDEDELGGITFEYFLTILNQDKSKAERKDTIRRVYRKYDKNNKGYITLQDLRTVVYKDLKEEIDEEVLAEIFRKTDSNQDGKMTFDDFYNVMTKKVYY